jgi:adenine C2-methylase RlmN of 23S rRNA A2503 and tRNA A37
VLTAGEIVGQVILANVPKATRILLDPDGFALSPRRVTVSVARYRVVTKYLPGAGGCAPSQG